MFHRSELGPYAVLLPCDKKSQIPELTDDWRRMEWELDWADTCDPDIIELLDDIWWPQLLNLAEQVRQKVREIAAD